MIMTFNRNAIYCLFLMLVAACSVDAAVIRLNLDLKSGKPEVVPLGYGVGRAELAAGGDRVVGVEIAADSLVMTPLQEGRTTVFVYDEAEIEKDRLEVFVLRGKGTGPLDAAIRSLLVDDHGKPIQSITVASVEGLEKVRLSGTVSTQLHFERVRQVREAFGDSVVDLTELDPIFGPAVVKDVRDRIGNGNIEITFSGRDLFLQGMTFSDAEKAFIESVTKSVYPSVKSFLTVKPWKGSEMPQDVVLEKPLLLLECQLIEITLDTMREMGVDWGGVQTLSASAGWSAAGAGSAVSSVSLATTKLFQLLTPHLQTGEARLLYTQNLVCEDGGKGRFLPADRFTLSPSARAARTWPWRRLNTELPWTWSPGLTVSGTCRRKSTSNSATWALLSPPIPRSLNGTCARRSMSNRARP
jgi:hypothetical protein